MVLSGTGWILSQNPQEVTGHCFPDEEIMAKAGIKDLSVYASRAECGAGTGSLRVVGSASFCNDVVLLSLPLCGRGK